MKHIMFYPQSQMLDDLTQQFFGEVFGNKSNSKYPLTDVYEEDGVGYMEIAVAGFSREDITIDVENDSLRIKGDILLKDTTNRIYLKKDIANRSFEKSYRLMFPIEDIEAEFKDGILKIKLIPKITNSNKKTIVIK